jgi:hypothetical protein
MTGPRLDVNAPKEKAGHTTGPSLDWLEQSVHHFHGIVVATPTSTRGSLLL